MKRSASNLSSESEDESFERSHKTYKSMNSDSGDSSDAVSMEPKNSVGSKKASSSSNFSNYAPFAQKMMQKMGYQEGSGLGKYGQGRSNIIERSQQRGRRGLGLHVPGFEPSEDVQWNSADEVISVDEIVSWIPECLEDPPEMAELRRWPKESNVKKLSIDDETTFCDQSIINKLLAGKSIFDKLEPEEMRKARTRSNPFETIRGVIFQNRAAMKMANMDFVFDFMFTEPVDPSGMPLVDPNELLYFADVCAGPGGFSEYVLWRKKLSCKGFGFTLKCQNDFKLEEFFAAPAEMFEPHYGVNGKDGDGDVFIPENAIAFRKFVLESTEGKGVHFVMADGGFSVEGQENIQEILSKQLYLCQFMFALSILRTNGHFVCKLFDIFTPFSVGLVYLMYRCFKQISIHKPNTSRPANSERYIICKWRKENTKDIHDFMFELNCRLQQLKFSDSNQDIVEIVPLELIKENEEFFQYIYDSNVSLGRRQIVSLAKIRAFAQNTELHEMQQSEMRKQCLEAWKIPDQVRSAPQRLDKRLLYNSMIKNENMTFVLKDAEDLNLENLNNIKSIYEYRCMVSGADNASKTDRGFILGLGRSSIMKGDGTHNCKWRKLELALELPKETVLYAEIVNELQGEGRAQKKVKALHILDALFIGGKDVRHLDFVERLAQAEKLAKAVSKPSRQDYSPIRVKELYNLKDLDLVFERLDMRMVKGSAGNFRLCYTKAENRYFLPSGIFFIKTITDPWVIAKSRRSGEMYYFNTRKNQSTFSCPPEAVADFKMCFSKRIFWKWERGVQILDSHQAYEDKVHKATICNFIEQRCST